MHGPLPARQAASLVVSPDHPLPCGSVNPGDRPVVSVGVRPSRGGTVLVEVRTESRPARFLRVAPEVGPSPGEWFRAVLPPVEGSGSLDYRVQLVSAGQLLARLPADGSWLTVTGGAARPAGPPTRQAVGEIPYWDYELQYIGSVTVAFRQEVIGATPDGYHVNFFIEGGRVVGPRLEATILPEGADWLWIRRDGIAAIDVRATWETPEGALISYRSGGVIELGPDGYANVIAGQLVGRPPFCCTINLLTSHARYEWVNRLQLLGFGRVDLERLDISYDVYTPELKDRPRRA